MIANHVAFNVYHKRDSFALYVTCYALHDPSRIPLPRRQDTRFYAGFLAINHYVNELSFAPISLA